MTVIFTRLVYFTIDVTKGHIFYDVGKQQGEGSMNIQLFRLCRKGVFWSLYVFFAFSFFYVKSVKTEWK